MKNWFKLLAVLLFSCVLAACTGSNAPEKVAEKYVEYLFEGNADEAVKLIYIPEEEKKPGMEDMLKGKVQMMVGGIKEKAEEKEGVKKIATEKSEIAEDGETARVDVKITFKNNETKNEAVRLKKADGQWKVILR